MKEKIYNLFYYTEDNKLSELGVREHEYTGTDDEKLEFLKNNVANDYDNCYKVKVISKILVNMPKDTQGYDDYKIIDASEINLAYFNEILEKLGAAKNILHVITPIVNGKVTIQLSMPNDYMSEYLNESYFEFDRLINDDYFDAIRILYNNKKYVSCTKLIVSFIDTISYLEYGDTKGSFTLWLDNFSKLDELGITSSQLWEYRNSILHMTNLESRKVLSGKEQRIKFIVARPGINSLPPQLEDCKVFNLYDLIFVLAEATKKWIESMNSERHKYDDFFKRYDTILSDRRISYYYTNHDDQ